MQPSRLSSHYPLVSSNVRIDDNMADITTHAYHHRAVLGKRTAVASRVHTMALRPSAPARCMVGRDLNLHDEDALRGIGGLRF
jgi:hypothetical protein